MRVISIVPEVGMDQGACSLPLSPDTKVHDVHDVGTLSPNTKVLKPLKDVCK